MANNKRDLKEILDDWEQIEHSTFYTDWVLDFFAKTKERIIYNDECDAYPGDSEYSDYISRIPLFFHVISKYASKAYVDYCDLKEKGIGYLVLYKEKLFIVAKNTKKGDNSYFLFSPKELNTSNFDVIDYDYVIKGTLPELHKKRVTAVDEFKKKLAEAKCSFTAAAEGAGMSEDIIRKIIAEM